MKMEPHLEIRVKDLKDGKYDNSYYYVVFVHNYTLARNTNASWPYLNPWVDPDVNHFVISKTYNIFSAA